MSRLKARTLLIGLTAVIIVLNGCAGSSKYVSTDTIDTATVCSMARSVCGRLFNEFRPREAL